MPFARLRGRQRAEAQPALNLLGLPQAARFSESSFPVDYQENVDRLVASIHHVVATRYPEGLTDNFRFRTSQRFRVSNPGHSKLLDVSDNILAAYQLVTNIDSVLEHEGVLNALDASTNKQRVLWSSNGVLTEEVTD